MRVCHLICAAAAAFIVTAAPALADCLEEVEALELAVLQGESEFAIDDATRTPAEKAQAAMSGDLRDHVREAVTAAKAGNEVQCFAVLQRALRIMAGL
jgi:hypothetical protein